MILSFADRETETGWRGIRSRRFPPDLQDAALRKLRLLDAASRLDDLKVPPGNRLEALKGDRKGQHSIRINNQWRICFHWIEGGAEDVEIVDYHRCAAPQPASGRNPAPRISRTHELEPIRARPRHRR